MNSLKVCDLSKAGHRLAAHQSGKAGSFRTCDYETIREQIRSRGIDSVTGDLGKLVQARTKGRGHGSTSRAFYARLRFVAHILNLQKLATMPRILPGPGEPEFI